MQGPLIPTRDSKISARIMRRENVRKGALQICEDKACHCGDLRENAMSRILKQRAFDFSRWETPGTMRVWIRRTEEVRLNSHPWNASLSDPTRLSASGTRPRTLAKRIAYRTRLRGDSINFALFAPMAGGIGHGMNKRMLHLGSVTFNARSDRLIDGASRTPIFDHKAHALQYRKIIAMECGR